jgi:hypothetical protein
MAKLTICTFLWHDDRAKCRNIYEFTTHHILRTKRQVDKYLTLPHEFVVVTDTPDILKDEADIRTVKLDKTTFVPGTRYAKLMLWRKDIGDIIGKRIAYIDLDCVITGSLDPVFDRPEDVVLWRNPNYGIKNRRGRYNTSIMLLNAGARPHLYDTFNPSKHPKELRKVMGGTDQAWVSTQLSTTDEAYWSSDDGVYGAGRLKDIAPGVKTTLPDNARIVFFPGPREPGMPEIQKIHPWIKDYFD